ncbi:MAG: GSCFA domain-containing protein [Bacteroidetes bacterium]|nr:GSCFA domain-containing protein [Bacteroidota bacterium]
MKWMLDLPFESPRVLIHHSHPILLIGSCFTNNVGNALEKLFFKVEANPSSIVFDPDSIVRHLEMALNNEEVQEKDQIYLNEKYQNLNFHSDLSSINLDEAIALQNQAIQKIRSFLSECRHLIITLGSAFAYRYNETGALVANCHRFPAQTFTKELLSVSFIEERMQSMLNTLYEKYSDIQVILTVSPVRHIRDGVVANNRSKGRLIEAVHRLKEQNAHVHYFPSYEWLIDVLRDYRFYDADLVHPNYAGTESVFEEFCKNCMDDFTRAQLPVLKQLRNGLSHIPRFPDSQEHRQFLEHNKELQSKVVSELPWINLKKK